jgi:transposase
VQTVVERSAALDVHKASVTACVRVPGEQHIEQFSTTARGLLALRDWLAGFGVTHVAMEASGVYWKAPWAILEDEFECLLVNARHVKQVPGRKTDVGDAEWLCRLVEAGLLRANLVPPKPIRQLRNLTRYRKTQIQERAQLRKKIPALRDALQGRFEEHHALWIGAILKHIDFLDQQIEGLTEAIGEQIKPLAPAVELLCTITGVQSRAAEVIISEIGGDMSRFPTPRHLASWAGQCPGNDQSAGKRRSGKTRNGSKWLDWTLEEVAIAAIRVKGTYLHAQYQRLRPRRGHKKALGAVKHTVICAVWHMLTTGEIYHDLGSDYFTRRDPQRRTKRLIQQLQQLGHTVTLTTPPTPQT